mmetsp:Transcript_32817/g.54195  ORF Transcript_32817/g.54195 Transcript_32817/m.54195 type:complete len:213 (-) Transcript_32817:187-825(-)|eukprot:CAMPEP_0119006184 /NCGR_PEP_ID=MMETSP1176-20130426/2156_1 /TAXON_ID=265551 /ORGANISM="Synedropsis recta cf, Strain CCMP1620" /LENGTH=212 /DNA_ID=CAMNT_0006958073 /DNA_START=72 /DNA_END=710 /DNA_ORIENTATION=+
MMLRRVALLLALLLATDGTSAFVVTPPPSIRCSSTERAAVIEPYMIDGAIALASAAAGAASQFPRIQQLERELGSARSALTKSEAELADKVMQLEDKLFRMDQEFESQSDKIRKNFDMTLRNELERVRKKVREEYQFTLAIKVQEERSRMLQEKVNFVGSVNGDKDQELVSLRLKQVQVATTNQKLEDALTGAQSELERLQTMASKKSWWPF